MAEKKRTRRSFGGLRQRNSGRWQAWYTGPDLGTHRAPRTFEAKDDAIAWLAAERRKIELGDWTPPGAPPKRKRQAALTVRSYAERWYAETEGRHKPRTRSENRRLLDAVILPELGDVPLTALTATDVREWFAGLEDRPARNANAYGLIRTIMAQAVDDELRPDNPCRIKRASTKHRKVEPVALSPKEIRALAAGMPPRYQALVLLAGFSGLRWGELTALQRRDLTLTKGKASVTVRRAVVRVSGGYSVGRPKSEAALRSVPLPDELIPILKAHIAAHSGAGRAGLVFPASGGGHLNFGTVRRAFARAHTAIGYETMRWHDLRNSALTLWAQQSGMTLADHMALAGHTSVAMSARYIRSRETARRDLIAGIWD